MVEATQPQARLSPIQEAVQLTQNIVQAGEHGMDNVNKLHALMSNWAFAQMRTEYEQQLREADPDYVLTIEEVLDEANEDTPMAAAYWAATSTFFRKVYQACAASA